MGLCCWESWTDGKAGYCVCCVPRWARWSAGQVRGEVLKTKVFSGQSLGSKGSDTRVIFSHIIVVLKSRWWLFLVASAVPLISTSLPSGVVCKRNGHRRSRARAGERGPGAPAPRSARGLTGLRAWVTQGNASVFQHFNRLNLMNFPRGQNILVPAVRFVNTYERRGAGQTLAGPVYM